MLALKISPNASKLARAGQRIDISFSSYCTTTRLRTRRTRERWWERQVGRVRGCARLSLIWGLEFSACCEVSGPCPLLDACCATLGKYFDPMGDRDWYGPQSSAHEGTKISRDIPRGLMAQGITNDSVTCGPVQGVLVQGILNKILPSGVCEWGADQCDYYQVTTNNPQNV